MLGAAFAAALVWASSLISLRTNLGVDQPAGLRKAHGQAVSRLGGVGLFLGLACALLVLAFGLNGGRSDSTYMGLWLCLCTLPAFTGGLVEDLTGRTGIWPRVLLAAVGAALAWWLLGARVTRLDLPLLDFLLQWSPAVAFAFTLFATAGVTHGMNVIDGCNGLCTGIAVTILGAIAWVASDLNDAALVSACLVAAGAALGFGIWNFPWGRVFLGDAGAYCLGFWCAQLGILLVARHPEVSPWFTLLILIYPITETLFTVYRRHWVMRRALGAPDALHLHQLVIARAMHFPARSQDLSHKKWRSALTSLWLYGLNLIPTMLALSWWNETPLLIGTSLVFVAIYLSLYRSLVKFRVPQVLAYASAMRRDGGRSIR